MFMKTFATKLIIKIEKILQLLIIKIEKIFKELDGRK